MAMAAGAASDVAKGKLAAVRVFDIATRASKIDYTKKDGQKLSGLKGRLTLTDVHFAYPARPEQPICQGYTLHVEPGTTVALCGESGSGKSTAVSLMERFYDPDQGSVMLDGVDLKDLDVSWLRQQIGMVGQEPVLFSGTIADNIQTASLAPPAPRSRLLESRR